MNYNNYNFFYLLILIPLLLSTPVIERFTTNEDEGIYLYGAIRILNGQIPYRDFWHITLPGAVWMIAGVFNIFGDTLLTIRTLALLLIICQGILIYLIGRRVTEKAIYAFMASMIFYLFNIIPSISFTPHKPAVLFALIAFLFYLNGRNLLSGFTLSLSLFMQQNIGALAFAGIVVSILGEGYIFEKEKKVLNCVAHIVLGFSIPLIFFVPYILLTGAGSEAYYTLFVWPLQGYLGFNRYPYFNCELERFKVVLSSAANLHIISRISGAGTLVFIGLLPPIFFLLNFIISIIQKKKEVFKITLCGTFLFLSAFTRPDFLHILYTLPVFFILFFYTIATIKEMKWFAREIAIIFAIILLGSVLTERGLAFLHILSTPHKTIETERGSVRVPAYNYEVIYGVLSTVREQTLPDDKIFIYHWSPSLYFYLNRDNPTRFDSYKPIYNSNEQIIDILKALIQNTPKLIVRDDHIERILNPTHPRSLSCTFPEINRDKLKIDPVDEYVMESGILLQTIGHFKLYKSQIH